MTRHTGCLFAAVAILIGASLNEIGRIVSGSPWPHVAAPIQSHVISAVFATLWLATVTSLLMRHRSDTWYTVSWMVSIGAVAAMVFHGAVLRLLGNPLGVLFIPLAGLLAFCITQSFGPGEFPAYQERMTRRAHRTSRAH
jgi:hypothetical protein